MRVAVVGGGITGLAAAWELRHSAEVTVFEADRPGGKLRTTGFAGRPVDEGPDAFLTRVPGAVELCRELGMDADLVAPAAGRTMIFSGGRLRSLPPGLVLGVPKELGPVARSGLLTPVGMLRAGLDLVLPRRALGSDASIDDLVAGRFGHQVATRLVEPLLGSIHAARTADLSAAATAPQLLAAARSSRSLLLGLRRQPAPPPGGSIFAAPRGGLAVLVDRLCAELGESGVRFESVRVGPVGLPPAGVEVGGDRFDAAVLAVPATEAARLLGADAPEGLAGIALTTVNLVTLAVPEADLGVGPDVNGILVPPAEGTLVTAMSFGSHKWPHWQPESGVCVLRVSAGRSGDERADRLSDDALVTRVCDEVGAMLGRSLTPARHRVSRWPGAFPLYRVGHLERVAAMESDLGRRQPQLALAGSSYRGAGIPACISGGRAAARRLATSVSSR